LDFFVVVVGLGVLVCLWLLFGFFFYVMFFLGEDNKPKTCVLKLMEDTLLSLGSSLWLWLLG